jgi:endonuclease YncB( thermonuclease family)
MVSRTMNRAVAVTVLVGGAVLAIGAAKTFVPQAQERIAGRAQVIDGDSLEIGSARLRLYGIDAPEGRQSCTRDGRAWACGIEATRKLRSLIGDRPISCTQRDVDDYERIVAVCRSGNADLAAELVRSGFATAYRRYSSDYADEESEARAARRGLWAGEFDAPEDYRRNEAPARSSDRGTTPSRASRGACAIKGNINDGQRIYHVPGSSSYDDTEIDEDRGERWFCSEAEARAAGWRARRS